MKASHFEFALESEYELGTAKSHCHGLLASGIRYDVSKDVAILAISPIADRHLAALREAHLLLLGVGGGDGNVGGGVGREFRHRTRTTQPLA